MSKYQANFLRKGRQSAWLSSLDLSVKQMAEVCSCSERSIRDWKREKFLMDYEALLSLCQHAELQVPDIQRVLRYAHLSAAGRKGGEIVINKYGKVPVSEARRLFGWTKWWQRDGNLRTDAIWSPRAFVRPEHSSALAEFVGIMLGDGGMSRRQLSVTLHSIDDREYGIYVRRLVTALFKVPVKVRRKNKGNADDYVISRVGLVDFCIEELGLVRGDKIRGGADVPMWVKSHRHFLTACLRGLVDTDGSIFTHTYEVKNRTYHYKKLNFSSRSQLLLRSVYEMMRAIGLNPHVRDSQVCLDSQKDVAAYIKIVGTNNPKHLKRYLK